MRIPTSAPLLLVFLVIGFSAPPGTARADHAFVITTDYFTGGSASMRIDSPWTVYDDDVAPVCSDAVVRTFGNRHYVVNRAGCDNIQVIDTTTFDTVAEFTVGAGSNPHDIVEISGGKAYVTRYDSSLLYVVHPTTGAVLASLDLGGYADGDGLPEMSMMARDGDNVFVQIQRLDRDQFYSPVAPSYLLVIDATTDTITDAIALTGTNPAGKMQIDGPARRLYVTCGGNFGVTDGGVEVIDLDALTSLGYVTTEVQLGGDVSSGRIVPGTDRGYALASDDFFFTTSLVAFDTATGAPTSTLYTTEAFVPGLIYDEPSGQLFLPDQSATNPGLRVFDAITATELTSAPIDVGLPPFDVTFYRAPVSVPGGDGPLSLITATPNPSAGPTRFTVGGEFGDVVAARVFDAFGRHVRTLAADALTWDGADDAGRPVAAGVYFVRFTDGTRVARARVVIQR